MDAVMELEIGPGPDAGSFTVRVLRSVGGGEPTGVVRLDVDQLAARRPLLEASVLASAVSARRVLPATESVLRDMGEQLFDATFAGDVGATYRTSRAIAAERGTGLQIALRLTAPELATLPWESLFDPQADAYLSRKEPLVRFVPAPYSPPALEIESPLRILAMVASPRGLPDLDVEAERQRLEEALHSHLERGSIELEWLDDASWAGIHGKLLEQQWHVLHFVGHGTYDAATDEGMLAFVGPDGRADLVPANALADLLDEAEPTPRLVVLNSCESGATGGSDLFSGTAAALAHSGIHAVAAMQFSISDRAAIAFARGFYTALAQGRDVDEAVRSGRIGILGTGRGTLEWVTPVLYLRGEDAHLFSMAPIREPDAAVAAPPEGGPTPVPRAAAAAAPPPETTAGPPAPAPAPSSPQTTAPPPESGSRGSARRWLPWLAVGGVVVAGGVALLALQPWAPEDAGGGSAEEGGVSPDDATGPVGGIGDTTYTEVVVPMDARVTVTDVWCAAGDRLDITAWGQAWHDETDASLVGPDGLTGGEYPDARILTTANTASIIGVLEDTDEAPFFVGSGTRYACPVDGTLYLGINDTKLAGNRGEFTVGITHVPGD